MVDIAERMCISRSGVTQSVDRLEKLGLVERVTNRDDRRLVFAVITSAGRALVPRGKDIIEGVASQFITQALDEDQKAALTSVLMKIIHVKASMTPLSLGQPLESAL